MIHAIEKSNFVENKAGQQPYLYGPSGPKPGEPLYYYDRRRKRAEAQYDAKQAARKGRKRKWPTA